MRKDIIKNKINEIVQSLDLVIENMPDTFDKFNESGIIKDGIYKRIEYSIENLIDIFYIFNSDFNLGIHSDDTDLINNLKAKNIISEDIALRIRNLKDFRNIVVYGYGEIDNRMAYDFIKTNLDDFYMIIKSIESVIDQN
ncbi:type VII toxin-antitoxin system HepT family RNase toxin [Ferroplasma acidiphilum]|uniref:type VII toxin-antitoxin system HepT family RNase toxin n=1 Tax=Ferroplasma acidiphilum TaxID=74969 RepID=UPI0023F29069|nr:HepT-like ribonuclease domain-containing protein [Ferroplasma acidiphilum]